MAVQNLAASLLLIMTSYHVADSLQLMSIFLLRCWHITLAPLFIYHIMLWVFGIGIVYWVACIGTKAMPPVLSPWPFWVCSGVGLCIAAILFLLVLCRAVPCNARNPSSVNRSKAPQSVTIPSRFCGFL